jgi:hypothetical protein
VDDDYRRVALSTMRELMIQRLAHSRNGELVEDMCHGGVVEMTDDGVLRAELRIGHLQGHP